MIRPFTCYECNKTVKCSVIPHGWLSVKSSNGKVLAGEKSTLKGEGLFCSTECMLDFFDSKLTEKETVSR